MKNERRLVISFSGGRTSGYMTWRILQEWRDNYDTIIVLFANTGCEHEKTLEFVNNCDKFFGFNTVWLESVPQQQLGKGCQGKVVTFETASRNGEPFEAAIKRYGIFNAAVPNCTDRLKVMPMRHYVRETLGWKLGTYQQCVGIRADEIDRMSVRAEQNRIIYPLIKWNITKTMVLDWWANQAFDLDLEEHLGNCVWCWKKTDRKLMTIAKDNPEFFDFPIAMEEKYHTWTSPKNGRVIEGKCFFRNNRTAKDIIAASKTPFIPWTPTVAQQQMGLFSLDEMDISNGCSESCDVEYI